jgi:hypothetical protein
MSDAPPSPAAPVRRRTRTPSRHLPRGLQVPSPETFDANVAEIQQMFGINYDTEAIVAALYHARNSVQLAANSLMGGQQRPLPSAGRVLQPVLTDSRYPEARAVVQLRQALLQREGFPAVLAAIRAVSPQLLAQIDANVLPFFVALGLPVAPGSGPAYRLVPSSAMDSRIQAAIPQVERLTRLGYRRNDVVRAMQRDPDNAERILRGEE